MIKKGIILTDGKAGERVLVKLDEPLRFREYKGKWSQIKEKGRVYYPKQMTKKQDKKKRFLNNGEFCYKIGKQEGIKQEQERILKIIDKRIRACRENIELGLKPVDYKEFESRLEELKQKISEDRT